MEAFLGTLEATALAETLRGARWGYAAVNTTHIFGIALLIGATLPLDLHLLGFWRSVPRTPLVRVLVPVAATGLAIAVVAGSLLFIVRAREYAGIEFLQAKLALITVGTLAALTLHRRYGFLLEQAGRSTLIRHALLSMSCWIGALVCGRLIAFTAP